MLLYKIIFINGIISILLLPNTYYIANIHPLVFNKEYSNNPLLKRLLAYWILTYGFIRVSIIIKIQSCFIIFYRSICICI
jgi:hypothetical protein